MKVELFEEATNCLVWGAAMRGQVLFSKNPRKLQAYDKGLAALEASGVITVQASAHLQQMLSHQP